MNDEQQHFVPDGTAALHGEDDEFIEYDLVEELVTKLDRMVQLQEQQLQLMATLTYQLSRKKRIVRDANNRIIGTDFE